MTSCGPIALDQENGIGLQAAALGVKQLASADRGHLCVQHCAGP
jgi:hypothetical protein